MKSFGFPRMLFEKNEKRDFTPDFFRRMRDFKIKIFLEDNYGSRLGYSKDDYFQSNPEISFVPRRKTFQCEVVTIIRTPSLKELILMKKDSVLFSMIHFVTHQKRCISLNNRGVFMFAMDSVVDDFGRRMIEFTQGTTENAIHSAVKQFLKNKPDANEIRFLILGSGMVGKAAVDTAIHASNIHCICLTVGKKTTRNIDKLKELIAKTDILIDATYRRNTSMVIISNEMLGHLPQESIVLDLSADDYDTNVEPMQVKAIEGIPTGNLDKYFFMPDDEAFEKIPKGINSLNRRPTFSCYSWPAVDARKCLKVYEMQLLPFMKIFSEMDVDAIKPNDENYLVRVLAKSNYQHLYLPTIS